MTPAVRYLEQAGISHELLTYDAAQLRDAHVGVAAAAALALPPGLVFKTLVAELDHAEPVIAVIPVAKTLDVKALAKAAGRRRARLADAQAAERSTGYVVGGISPFGQKKPLPTFLASEALDNERIYVSGGKRGLEIGLATADLIRCCQARVCELCRRS